MIEKLLDWLQMTSVHICSKQQRSLDKNIWKGFICCQPLHQHFLIALLQWHQKPGQEYTGMCGHINTTLTCVLMSVSARKRNIYPGISLDHCLALGTKRLMFTCHQADCPNILSSVSAASSKGSSSSVIFTFFTLGLHNGVGNRNEKCTC